MLLIAAAGAGYADDAMNLAFFLDRLGNENSWLAPLDSEHVYMASSNQPVNRRDCNAFLRTEEENGKVWKVLVDLDGPGVISRFWTAGDFDGALRIVIDSSTVVTTTLTLEEMEPRLSSRFNDHDVSNSFEITAPDFRGDRSRGQSKSPRRKAR